MCMTFNATNVQTTCDNKGGIIIFNKLSEVPDYAEKHHNMMTSLKVGIGYRG